jgi:hypothetical protein
MRASRARRRIWSSESDMFYSLNCNRKAPATREFFPSIQALR